MWWKNNVSVCERRYEEYGMKQDDWIEDLVLCEGRKEIEDINKNLIGQVGESQICVMGSPNKKRETNQEAYTAGVSGGRVNINSVYSPEVHKIYYCRGFRRKRVTSTVSNPQMSILPWATLINDCNSLTVQKSNKDTISCFDKERGGPSNFVESKKRTSRR